MYEHAIELLRFTSDVNDIANMVADDYNSYLEVYNFISNFVNQY